MIIIYWVTPAASSLVSVSSIIGGPPICRETSSVSALTFPDSQLAYFDSGGDEVVNKWDVYTSTVIQFICYLTGQAKVSCGVRFPPLSENLCLKFQNHQNHTLDTSKS
jgi:hypothetical protein